MSMVVASHKVQQSFLFSVSLIKKIIILSALINAQVAYNYLLQDINNFKKNRLIKPFGTNAH